MLDIVRKAADRIGGVPRLAERIGVTRQAIYQWREVPADRVADIAATTGVPRVELRPDLFAGTEDLQAWRLDADDEAARKPAPDFSELRRDSFAWLERQSEALAAGQMGNVDTDRLVTVLRSLSHDARVDIERRLEVILVRLMKWQYRRDRRSLSTIAVITAARSRLLQRFAEAPSLREHAEQALSRLYAGAILIAADETGLAPDAFPVDCPFGLDDLLDPAFAPPATAAV